MDNSIRGSLLEFILYLSQVTFLRKSLGSRLNIFAPINDLSSLSRTGSEGLPVTAPVKNDVTIAGGQILGDEYSDHVIRVRSGIVDYGRADS